MSKMAKRWRQEDDMGDVAIGYTYVGEDGVSLPVLYQQGAFNIPGDVVFVNAGGQRVRLRIDKARSVTQIAKALDSFFESGGTVKGRFNSVPAKPMMAGDLSRELVAVTKDLIAAKMDSAQAKAAVIRTASKVVSLLDSLDKILSAAYYGDKGDFDGALHELRFNHIRQAMDRLNTGDLLSLLKRMERAEKARSASTSRKATKVTRATIKSILKRMKLDGKADIDGQYVEFWPTAFATGQDDEGWDEGRELAEKAAEAFAKAIGGSVWTNQSYWRVRWKGEEIDMGDWNDPGSRWHY